LHRVQGRVRPLWVLWAQLILNTKKYFSSQCHFYLYVARSSQPKGYDRKEHIVACWIYVIMSYNAAWRLNISLYYLCKRMPSGLTMIFVLFFCCLQCKLFFSLMQGSLEFNSYYLPSEIHNVLGKNLAGSWNYCVAHMFSIM
jgi:hypothetical protein